MLPRKEKRKKKNLFTHLFIYIVFVKQFTNVPNDKNFIFVAFLPKPKQKTRLDYVT